jgi:hypothetical protein
VEHQRVNNLEKNDQNCHPDSVDGPLELLIPRRLHKMPASAGPQ